MAKSKAKSEVIPEQKEEVLEQPQTPNEEPAVVIVEAPKYMPYQPPTFNVDGDTFEERFLNYLKGKSGVVRVNDFLRHEFKQGLANLQVNKTMKATFEKLVSNDVIEFSNDSWKRLGKHFYATDKPETQYRTAANTILEVKLK